MGISSNERPKGVVPTIEVLKSWYRGPEGAHLVKESPKGLLLFLEDLKVFYIVWNTRILLLFRKPKDFSLLLKYPKVFFKLSKGLKVPGRPSFRRIFQYLLALKT